MGQVSPGRQARAHAPVAGGGGVRGGPRWLWGARALRPRMIRSPGGQITPRHLAGGDRRSRRRRGQSYADCSSTDGVAIYRCEEIRTYQAITSPSADRERFMAFPSSIVNPDAPVFSNRSLPPRSMSQSLLTSSVAPCLLMIVNPPVRPARDVIDICPRC